MVSLHISICAKLALEAFELCVMLSMWASNPLRLAVGQRGARHFRRHCSWLASMACLRPPDFGMIAPIVEIWGVLVIAGTTTWRLVHPIRSLWECAMHALEVS